jgi:adenosylcobinamide kinase / adenosylcobinamide-phosphate guanylyltransferase
MPIRTLVIGGQRSGKSRYAETLVAASGLVPVYLATGTAEDAAMRDRIDAHRSRRGAEWRTVEEPLDLPAALLRESGPGFHLLVDCLTLWVSNLMGEGRDVQSETRGLVEALARVTGPVTLVTGEVGLGVIPENQLARRYADALGSTNQEVAASVDRVILISAGLPLMLKTEQPNTEVDI